MNIEEVARMAFALADDAEAPPGRMSRWALAFWVLVGAAWGLAVGGGAVWAWGRIVG